MAERVDFSKNAPVFDRRHGSALADDEVDRLWKAAGLHSGVAILDIGAGTGRVAIPLGIRGCAVVALEPAWGMVDRLRAKANGSTIAVVVGEGGQLPFQAGAFNAVVIARLLYLAKDWRDILRESHRVLIAGGTVLHEWGNGEVEEEWVQIREEARRLFERAGVSDPFHPGVRSESDVDADLTNLGFVRPSHVVAGPGRTITLREFLRRLVEGEFSSTWDVPKNVFSRMPSQATNLVRGTFDLDRSVAMPREIRWAIYQKDAASNTRIWTPPSSKKDVAVRFLSLTATKDVSFVA